MLGVRTRDGFSRRNARNTAARRSLALERLESRVLLDFTIAGTDGGTRSDGEVTDVWVDRWIDYEYPGPGDDDYIYCVEVEGIALTGMHVTTPWDEDFDTVGILPDPWDGSDFEYEDGNLWFWAGIEHGSMWLEFEWDGLSPGQWADLETGQTDISVTYTGGTWEGTVDFSGLSVPGEMPQITSPTHEETDVGLTPEFEWDPWGSPGPDAGISVDLGPTSGGDWVGDDLASDATSWTPPDPLEPGTEYEFELAFFNEMVVPVNGVDVYVSAATGAEVLFTTGAGGVTDVWVDCGLSYGYPGVGDEEYVYCAEVEGVALTGLAVTTPWGEEFDSEGILPELWDGTYYQYSDGNLWFDAGTDNGSRWLCVEWDDLSGSQWADLATGQTDMSVTYTGGTWGGTVDFSGVDVPAEAPQITNPAHEETDVGLTPTLEWNAWASPGPNAGIWLEVWPTAGGEWFDDDLASDATSWTPSEPLDPGTEYEFELAFFNAALVPVGGVDVQVAAATAAEVLFTTQSGGELTQICVDRGIDYEYPGAGDDYYEYCVEAKGIALTGLQVTTPWGVEFDSDGILPGGWDGSQFCYDEGNMQFWAATGEGYTWLEVCWGGLLPDEWADLATGQTDMTISYTGGTWNGTVDFTGADVPAQMPQIISPAHEETDVSVLPDFAWMAWGSPGPGGEIEVGLEPTGDSEELEEMLAADATGWSPLDALDPSTEYQFQLDFLNAGVVQVAGVDVHVGGWTECEVLFTTAGAGELTNVWVDRGRDYEYPGAGDDYYEYCVSVSGIALTGLAVTTPWGEEAGGGLLPDPWDGAFYQYSDGNMYFEAGTDNGFTWIELWWEDLSAGHWADLATGQTDISVTYTGGTWDGTVDFSGVDVPAEGAQITSPTHEQTGVSLLPDFEWLAWGSPGPGGRADVCLSWGDDDETEEDLAADATAWTPPDPLDPNTECEFSVGFSNIAIVPVSGVAVYVEGWTEAEILFTTGTPGPTTVWVERGQDHEYPGAGDESYEYLVEIEGADLTRLQVTTPWGEEFDSDGILPGGWDGSDFSYSADDMWFCAGVEEGSTWFEVEWEDLSGAEWVAVATTDADLTVDYPGGSWNASVGLGGASMPAEVPVLTSPAHGDVGVQLSPTLQWLTWAGPAPGAVIWMELGLVGEDECLYEEDLPADATQWPVPARLDPNEQYEYAVGFVNRADFAVGGVDVHASSYTEADARFTTEAALYQWQSESGEVVVSIYDVVGGEDVDPADIQVKFGKGDTVLSIKLGGEQPMDGLAIVISGADAVGSIKDGRKGDHGELAFIASDAPIKSIALKSGTAGFNLNGLTLGGIAFPADVDGDGATDDATALYCTAYVGKLALTGDSAGDFVLVGADPAKGVSVAAFTVKNGGLTGDLTTAGAVAKLAFAGDVDGDVMVGGADGKGVAVKAFQVKGGGYHGDMVLLGNAGKIALGGDLASSIHVTGNMKALDLKGGDLDGPVTVDGYAAKIGVATAKDKATGLYAGGSVTANGVITVDGVDAKDVSLKQLAVKGGGLAGDVNTPNGGIGKVSVAGGYVTSELTIGGGLAAVSVKSAKDRATGATVGGSALGARFDVAGLLKSLKLTGDFTDSDVDAGELSKVAVKGMISQTGGSHGIVAHAGSYKIQDATWKGVIDATAAHDFAGGLHAWLDA